MATKSKVFVPCKRHGGTINGPRSKNKLCFWHCKGGEAFTLKQKTECVSLSREELVYLFESVREFLYPGAKPGGA